MKEIDRRSVIGGLLCGAAVTAIGLTVRSEPAKSLPLAAAKDGIAEPEDLVEEAAVHIHVHPRRHRHRRWRCRRHGGRKVCGWR
jgi:hypothetical protein